MLLVPEGVRELETERRWKLFQGVSWLRTLVLNTEMRDLTNRTKKDQKNAWTKLHVCPFIFLVKRFLLNFLVLFARNKEFGLFKAPPLKK